MDLLTRQMADQEGVTEELKAADQLDWVQRMNSIHNRAEEIVLSELVYCWGGWECRFLKINVVKGIISVLIALQIEKNAFSPAPVWLENTLFSCLLYGCGRLVFLFDTAAF